MQRLAVLNAIVGTQTDIRADTQREDLGNFFYDSVKFVLKKVIKD